MRLYTTVNEDVNFFISDIQRDDVTLEKSNLLVRNFKGEGIPIVYDLAQNYPNPFNPATTLSYSLPRGANAVLSVVNLHGQIVATLANGYHEAGVYQVTFDAANLPSGVYFAMFKAGTVSQVRRMLLAK